MFFNPSDLSEAKRSMSDYREWAGEIANSYFNANAIPTDTLTKIARVEELLPHEIEILAAETNKLIHHHKYAEEKEKYFAAEFPLADARAAISALQVDGGIKTASAEFVEPKVSDTGPDPFEMFGIKPEEIDKTAEVRHQVKIASEKADLLSQKIQDRIIDLSSQLESASMRFIKEARQHLIQESGSAARMKALGTLDHFVKCAEISAGKKLLAKLAYVLSKEGLLESVPAKNAIEYFTKEADCKAPEELISENLGVRVVNGSHPLYITLKTVGDLEAELLRYENQGILTDDKVRILRQKVRAL